MAHPYATAALIRSIEEAFNDSTEFPDATLTGWADNFGDEIIDARLNAAGFSMPPDTTTNLLKVISSMLAAAHGLDSFMGQRTFDAVPRAKALREQAMDLLDKIANGTLDAGLTQSSSGEPIVVDSDPETFPDTAAVVGDEEDWAWPAEDRED